MDPFLFGFVLVWGRGTQCQAKSPICLTSFLVRLRFVVFAWSNLCVELDGGTVLLFGECRVSCCAPLFAHTWGLMALV